MSNEPTGWRNLTKKKLEKLPTKRLVNVLRLARKSANTSECCGCCGEPYSYLYGEDDQRAIRGAEAYEFYSMVKSICDKRENVS